MIAAKYYDGKQSAFYNVYVDIEMERLAIKGDNLDLFWDYSSLLIPVKPEANQPLILTNLSQPDARLVIADNTLYNQVRRKIPKNNAPRFSISLSWPSLSVWFLLSILALGGAYSLSDPLLDFTTQHFPRSWEKKLGDAIIGQLVNEEHVCKNKRGQNALDKIIKQLRTTVPVTEPLTVRIVDDEEVNAFAAPNNQIIIYSGLLEQSHTQEELIGVIAHEIGHVIKRHTINGLVKSLGYSLFLTLTIGDIQSIHLANNLLQLKYSRDHEREADLIACEILYKVNVDSKGLVSFLEKAAKEEGSILSKAAFFSTHPAIHERINYLKQGKSTKKPKSILNAKEWKDLKNICKG